MFFHSCDPSHYLYLNGKEKKTTHFLEKREPLLLQSQRVSASNRKNRSVYHLQLLCQCVTSVKVSFLAISSLYVSAL